MGGEKDVDPLWGKRGQGGSPTRTHGGGEVGGQKDPNYPPVETILIEEEKN